MQERWVDGPWVNRLRVLLLLAGALLAGACDDGMSPISRERPLDATLVAEGKEIFRYDTFGDEVYWSDTLQMHQVIEAALTPKLALELGLKVDVEALPSDLLDAIAAGEVDLESPATTLALLQLDAVLGVSGTVEEIDGTPRLTRMGVTCALCHSTVDNSFAPGIGRRLDGHANRDLNVGAIVALSPAVPQELKDIMNSWGPGMYDPRINMDGLNTPIVIPPAFGLRRVDLETFTGEGPVSYWNGYVAVTQMHGQGSFSDPRLGIDLVRSPDLVTDKLPALREYQFSLEAPAPPAGSFDVASAARGNGVFRGPAQCTTCHIPRLEYTDVNLGRLHEPEETGMDPSYAERTTQKLYRTTPLKGAWQHPPYFHDGSAATFEDVVEHYDRTLALGLSARQKRDLVEYLKSL